MLPKAPSALSSRVSPGVPAAKKASSIPKAPPVNGFKKFMNAKKASSIPKAPPPPAIRRPGVSVVKKNSRSLANQLANRRKGLKKPTSRFVPPMQGPMAAPPVMTNAQRIMAARFKAQREARSNPTAGPVSRPTPSFRAAGGAVRAGTRMERPWSGWSKPRPTPSFIGCRARTQQAGARMGARGGVSKPTASSSVPQGSPYRTQQGDARKAQTSPQFQGCRPV